MPVPTLKTILKQATLQTALKAENDTEIREHYWAMLEAGAWLDIRSDIFDEWTIFDVKRIRSIK